MKPSSDLLHAIAHTHLLTDGRCYLILHIAPEHQEELLPLASSMVPFSALILDKDEITLWVTTDLWESLKPVVTVVEVSPPYRLITFDIRLDLTLVGYLAAIATVLAEAGISIMTASAFSRDHILVAESDFERAWDTLWAYVRQCRAQKLESQKQVVQD